MTLSAGQNTGKRVNRDGDGELGHDRSGPVLRRLGIALVADAPTDVRRAS